MKRLKNLKSIPNILILDRIGSEMVVMLIFQFGINFVNKEPKTEPGSVPVNLLQFSFTEVSEVICSNEFGIVPDNCEFSSS